MSVSELACVWLVHTAVQVTQNAQAIIDGCHSYSCLNNRNQDIHWHRTRSKIGPWHIKPLDMAVGKWWGTLRHRAYALDGML